MQNENPRRADMAPEVRVLSVKKRLRQPVGVSPSTRLSFPANLFSVSTAADAVPLVGFSSSYPVPSNAPL